MIRAVATLLLVGLAGCASTLENRELIAAAQPGDAVKGIPYRARDRIVIEVYQLTDKGYVERGRQVDNLADPSRVYLLNFNGQLLSDANMKFEQRADGTIAKVHMSDKGGAPGVLTAAGDALVKYRTNELAIQKGEEERAAADLAKLEAADAKARTDAEAAFQRSDTAVDLLYAARKAEQLLAELPADAKGSERIEAERQMINARRAANKAARDAGLEEPYPGV